MLDRDVEAAALAAHDRAGAPLARQKGPHRLGVERRRHREHRELGPGAARSRRSQARARSVATWRSCSSSSTTAATPAQPRIGEQPPQEQPLGEKQDPGLRPGGLVEADGITHALADALAELRRDPGGCQARGQPPGLEHPDLPLVPPPGVEEGAWNPGGLAGAGRGLHDHRPLDAGGRHDFGERAVDRKGGRKGEGRGHRQARARARR